MERQQIKVLKRRVRTEVVTVFDATTDCLVQKVVAKSREPIPLGLPTDDIIRRPILEILITQEQDRDPKTGLYCIRSDRGACTLYDDLVKASRRFTERVPKREQSRYMNPSERVLLNANPPFCEACIWVEHARRRRANSRLRRFIRWLRPSR